MASFNLRTLTAAVLATGLAGAADPAWATLPVSQQPLTLPGRVKPAFLMALDNSGSMGSDETLCHTNQGGCFWNSTTRSFFDAAGVALESGHSYVRVMRGGSSSDNSGSEVPRVDKYGAARDPEFNRAYYNPDAAYTPWLKFDGSPYTNGSVVDSVTGNALIAAAPEDPRHPATATDGGTGVTIDFTSSVDVTYKYVAGDILFKGTTYFNDGRCNNLPTPGSGPSGGTSTWITLAADLTFVGNCTTKTKFYPATVYLTAAATPPAGFDLSKRMTITGAGPAGASLYKYEILPGNFAVGADYAAAIQNFANYWTYYGDRVRSVVSGSTQAFTGVDYMRVGAFNINSAVNCNVTPCATDPKVSMYDLADYTAGGTRSSLYNQLLTFDRPGNNTPTRRAVFRLGDQFKRVKSVSDPNPPILLECQSNAGMLFTDGYINDDNGSQTYVAGGLVGNADGSMGAPFNDANTSTMADVAAYFYLNNLRPDLPAGKVPVPAGCASPSPSPKLDCQSNLHMNFFGIPLGARGRFYDVAPYIDLLSTPNNDEATAKAFTIPPAWAAKGLSNGTGGTTDLSPDAVDDLWHASMNSRGKFISAQSPAAVRDGIRTVINALLDAILPSGSQSVIGAHLGSDTLVFTPSFQVTDSGHDWKGDLVANRINADGSLGAQVWSAQTLLTAKSDALRSGRDIVVVTAPGDKVTRVPALFNPTNATAFGPDEATQLAFFGLLQPAFHAKYGAGVTTSDLIDYIKGVGANEEKVGAGHTFRNRTGVLGDIINSPPEVSSNKDDFGYAQSLTLTDHGGSQYTTFLTSKASRTPATMVYQGANDGMLHAFNGLDVGAGHGQEVFGFIPYSVTAKLGALIDPDYVHNFYVDGGTTVGDAYINGGWKTVLVGSTGSGGSGAYALDVTNPTTFASGYSSNVMWEHTKATSADIGQNVGRPVIFIGEDGTWYAAFGNGYNSTNSNPVLLIVNLQTGAIAKTLTGNDGGSYENGIGQIAAADVSGPLGVPDGKVDVIYGGDYRGNVWKFDLLSPTPASWANPSAPMFVATDSSGTLQPITGGFDLAPGPVGGVMVYFGTGSYFLDGDNVTPSPAPVHTLYAVWDNGSSATRSDLVQQTIDSQTSTVVVDTKGTPSTSDDTSETFQTRATSANPVVYSLAAGSQRGFYMDLINPGESTHVPPIAAGADGEKFFGTPLVLNGVVFFTTFAPNGDACSPGGSRWEYGFGSLSGAAALVGDLTLADGNICPGGHCGGVNAGDGANITSAGFTVPKTYSACRYGIDPGCPEPVAGSGDSGLSPKCYFIDNTDPLKPKKMARPCGRQSWRQVR